MRLLSLTFLLSLMTSWAYAQDCEDLIETATQQSILCANSESIKEMQECQLEAYEICIGSLRMENKHAQISAFMKEAMKSKVLCQKEMGSWENSPTQGPHDWQDVDNCLARMQYLFSQL